LKKINLIIIFVPFVFHSLVAQELAELNKRDTTTLAIALKKGKFEVHTRTFFMSTINEEELSNYHALATGAGIRYETPKWKGLNVGFSGYFIFNVTSSDLGKKDSLSGQTNRYEIGLFDISNAKNKSDLDRMEELYLKYHYKSFQITAGRQFINTPFINKQDGRMRPTIVEGIWTELKPGNNWMAHGGLIRKMSPRTTVSWYSIGESVGIYSQGVTSNGTKSDYAGNTSSRFIIITNLQYRNQLANLQLWNTYADNLMNTWWMQQELYWPVKKQSKWIAGIQFGWQHGVGYGGNTAIAKRYYEKKSHTWVVGSRFGYEATKWKTNLNYLHIGNDARFLMPREWGREPFYTFLPRERNEGLGGVNAWTINNEYTSANKFWKAGIGYGQYYLPGATNFRLNKYGLPSYRQLNLLGEFVPGGKLTNMDIQVLLVWKGNMETESLTTGQTINKVNMLNSSFVINYHF
jgi:hypothetical protein